MLSNYWGGIDNVKIDDNVLTGGGYTVYLNEGNSSNSSGEPMTNVSFTDNHLGSGTYGTLTTLSELGNQPTISGNVNDGAAIAASLDTTGQPSSGGSTGDTGTDPGTIGSDTGSHDGAGTGTDHDSGTVGSGTGSGSGTGTDTGTHTGTHTGSGAGTGSGSGSGHHNGNWAGHHHNGWDFGNHNSWGSTSSGWSGHDHGHFGLSNGATQTAQSGTAQTSNGGQSHVCTPAQDTFDFGSHFGNQTIQNFQANGAQHNVVQFSKSVFDNFADVLSHASQHGHDLTITSGAGDSLTLKDTKAADLHHNDFHFA
jgi:hypothetical protein